MLAMYLKKTPNLNGRIRLSIVDTYYDKAKKCSRQKTIESIGWLDELEKKYNDPIAHFQKRVEQLKAEKAARQAPIHFTFYDSDRLCIGDTAIFVKGCLCIMAVFQAKFDLIALLRHRLFILSPCGRLIRSAHTGLHTSFRFRSRPRFSHSRVRVRSGLLQYLLPYPGLCNRCTPRCPAG